MLATDPVSAIVVRIPVPRRLERLRARWDWAASVGVPAHVTILFPFLPAGRLEPDVRRQLAAVAADHAPFDVRFARVERFPGVVYLAPDPVAPFSRLIEAVHAAYPAYPPYGGAFAEVIPHLTVAESDEAPLDGVETEAATALPFGCRIKTLEVLIERGDGRWHSRWRIGLGVRP